MAEFTNKLLRKIYRFLFIDHSIVFCCLCIVMLIPTVLSHEFCRVWMVALVFLEMLALFGLIKGWNKEG